MSATADTFARSLEILADTMDDHGMPGEAVPSRVHLSCGSLSALREAPAGQAQPGAPGSQT